MAHQEHSMQSYHRYNREQDSYVVLNNVNIVEQLLTLFWTPSEVYPEF